MTGGARVLVVNADDFGLCEGVTRGVIEAHEHGIVTSASLMVRGADAPAAAAYARAHPRLAVGIHVDLAEWIPVGDGEWEALYEVVDTADAAAVEAEVDRQLARFHELVGAAPTHIDGHQHVQRGEPVATVVADRARALGGVPVRMQTPGISYCGAFYGQGHRGAPLPQAITVDALLAVLGSLPEGVTELCCHPGHLDGLDSVYGEERPVELAALTDPRVRAAVDDLGIELVSFREVRDRL